MCYTNRNHRQRDDLSRTGLRGKGLAESRVTRISDLSHVQGALGDQRPRSQGRQTLPRRFLAELHQPERAEHQQRRVRNFRVSNFYDFTEFGFVSFRDSLSRSSFIRDSLHPVTGDEKRAKITWKSDQGFRTKKHR